MGGGCGLCLQMVEYLVGDGPNNRYPLVCRKCHSHNGMALRDEFEYLTFRCAYCYHMNSAPKTRPVLRPNASSADSRGEGSNGGGAGSRGSERRGSGESAKGRPKSGAVSAPHTDAQVQLQG